MHRVKNNIEDLKKHLFYDKIYTPSRIVEFWNIAFPLEYVHINSKLFLTTVSKDILINTLSNGVYSTNHKYVMITKNDSLVSFSDPTRLDVDKFTQFVFNDPGTFHIELI
jgi:hypothetical protein